MTENFNNAVASIFISENSDREFDDWKCKLPIGLNVLYTKNICNEEEWEEEEKITNEFMDWWNSDIEQNELKNPYNKHTPIFWAWAAWKHSKKGALVKTNKTPLTDEQILSIHHYNPYQRAEISFARAIEELHGIK